jgi:WD40 repeat protein
MFSLGALFYNIVTGLEKNLYIKFISSEEDALNEISKDLDISCSKYLNEIILKLLRSNPEDRLTSKQVLKLLEFPISNYLSPKSLSFFFLDSNFSIYHLKNGKIELKFENKLVKPEKYVFNENYFLRFCVQNQSIHLATLGTNFDIKLSFTTFYSNDKSVSKLGLSDNFAIISKSANFAVFDLKSKKLISTLIGTKGNIECFHFFDEKCLISIGSDRKIRRWNVDSKNHFVLSEKIIKYEEKVYFLRSNENFISLVSSETHNINVINHNGVSICELKGHLNEVTEIIFHKDYLISSSLDGTIRFWNLDIGICTKSLSGHIDSIHCIKIQDDILISGSSDKTIRYWNMNTGECIGNFEHDLKILKFDSNLSKKTKLSKRLSFKLESNRKCICFIPCGHCKKKILVCNHGDLKRNIPFCFDENIDQLRKEDFCFDTGFSSQLFK